MNSLLIITITVLLTVSVNGQNQHRATLYEGLQGAGSYVVLPQEYANNLGTSNFDNRARSTCVVGVWLFYQNADFNPSGNGIVEYYFGPGSKFCDNFNALQRDVSSVRFAGSPSDYRTNTLTIYQHNWFQGDEQYTYVDLPNIAGSQKSLIITGSTPWTVFDRPNYQGNALCLYQPTSNNNSPLLLNDLLHADIPYNSIKSVKKGCVAERKWQPLVQVKFSPFLDDLSTPTTKHLVYRG